MATDAFPSSRAETLYQRLTQRFRLVRVSHQVGGEQVDLYKAENIDQLLNELIALDDDHISITDERLPYWADLWPAAIGLSEYLLRASWLEPGMQVLEIGCGMGLCGIIAGRAGAAVMMTDYLSEAIELAELNALTNRVEASYQLMDWRHPDPALQADVLLASEVPYENRAFQPLFQAFNTLVRPGGRVLLGEPRRNIAKPFLQALPGYGFFVEKSEAPVRLQDREIMTDVYEIRMG